MPIYFLQKAFEEHNACEMELKKNPGPKSTEDAFLDQLLSEFYGDGNIQPRLSKRIRVLHILESRR